MKKYFLFLNLFFMLFLGWSYTASAKKKYRYIKREHGVRFQWDNPMNFDGAFAASLDIEGAYTYNWKGMLEFGPYFKLDSDLSPPQVMEYAGGLIFEYNIVKNRGGKRKFIPAIGLSAGVTQVKPSNLLSFSGGAHAALKFFVGKRTPFIIMLGYKALTPMNAEFFKALSHRPYTSMGFSYYFDFY